MMIMAQQALRVNNAALKKNLPNDASYNDTEENAFGSNRHTTQ